jgi:hypothetical protein
MKKGIVAFVATIALAGPASAVAAPPIGTFVPNDNANPSANASCVGVLSSRLIQNGQFISGQDNVYDIDQTTLPGSRAAEVHVAQAQSTPVC